MGDISTNAIPTTEVVIPNEVGLTGIPLSGISLTGIPFTGIPTNDGQSDSDNDDHWHPPHNIWDDFSGDEDDEGDEDGENGENGEDSGVEANDDTP